MKRSLLTLILLTSSAISLADDFSAKWNSIPLAEMTNVMSNSGRNATLSLACQEGMRVLQLSARGTKFLNMQGRLNTSVPMTYLSDHVDEAEATGTLVGLMNSGTLAVLPSTWDAFEPLLKISLTRAKAMVRKQT